MEKEAATKWAETQHATKRMEMLAAKNETKRHIAINGHRAEHGHSRYALFPDRDRGDHHKAIYVQRQLNRVEFECNHNLTDSH